MKSKKCCIVIPIYNLCPRETEMISINRAIDVFYNHYDMYYVRSEKLPLDNYPYLPSVSFDDKYFISNKSYSKLLLRLDFYEPFQSYEFMLISQTDSYVLNSSYSIEFFMNKGYSYWGAPWPDGVLQKPYSIRDYFKLALVPGVQTLCVGNGGFSLRKISVMKRLIKTNRLYLRFLWYFNEDLFFSYMCRKENTLAPENDARFFAAEKDIIKLIELGIVPYGVHAWEKHCPYLLELDICSPVSTQT